MGSWVGGRRVGVIEEGVGRVVVVADRGVRVEDGGGEGGCRREFQVWRSVWSLEGGD